MSFLFRFFQKREEDDESVLSGLVQDIQKRQAKLDDIRYRERRTTLIVSVWTLSVWILYIAIWYGGFLERYWRSRSKKALVAVPVVIGPIIILFIRRIVQLWFESKGNAEEKTLRELRKKQHNKVEEIKKRTNYYSTRDLLQKYEVSSPANSPLRTPQRGDSLHAPNARPRKSVSKASSPLANSTPPNQPTPGTPSPAIAPTQNQRHWYDRLADVVLGEEVGQNDVARYALICEKCFAHNGLVKESVWEETQYVCPKCHHFNASMRAKKHPHSSPSPTSLSPSSPTPPSLPQQRSPRGAKESDLGSDSPEKPSASMMEVDL